MSGPTVKRVLHNHFETVRRAELDRLEKKLRGLSDDQRRSVDAITAEIIHAIAGVPESNLTDDVPQTAVDALVRLFALPETGAAS
ncbi:MAG TPA: hypothetical protein VEU08_23615 [Vicinamibacterales bacterium]|nr:hypothetical protein [Vicinamibacterales bacterium]